MVIIKIIVMTYLDSNVAFEQLTEHLHRILNMEVFDFYI